MPIAVGICCEACGTLHLISAAAKRNFIDQMKRVVGPDMFILTCPACGRLRSFHKNEMEPYVVSTRTHADGHAAGGNYILAGST